MTPRRRSAAAKRPTSATRLLLSPLPRLQPHSSQRRREFLSDEHLVLFSILYVFIPLYCSRMLFVSIPFFGSRRSLRRTGSNTNGLLYPELLSADCTLAETVPLGPSTLPAPMSLAIFLRKLAAWLAVSSGREILHNKRQSRLTGLENHLLPPISNQLRWPPMDVVHMTVYGFCLISSYGIASPTAIW